MESKVKLLIGSWRNILRAVGFKRSRSFRSQRRWRRGLSSYAKLEPRQLLAAITVSTLADETIANDTTSLREALVIARETDGADTITFASSLFSDGARRGLQLSSSHGTLEIDSDVAISGPRADLLTINGAALASDASVISVSGSEVTLSGLRIFGNHAGVRANLSSLTLDGVSLANGQNVGVVAHDSDLTIIDSEISNNLGRGIFFAGNNQAQAPLSLQVINSTISGNQTAIFARADADHDIDVEVINSTLTGNAVEGVRVTRFGSSIVNTQIHNTIIADNDSRDFVARAGSLGGDSAASNNLIGSSQVELFDTQTGFSVDDLQLQALALNGGSTRTHALGVESAAIDAGNSARALENNRALALSQNGAQRVRGLGVDIGAFERAPLTLNETTLEISTGGSNDVVELLNGLNGFVVSINDGQIRQGFQNVDVSNVLVATGGGDDVIFANLSIATDIRGGDGNDHITGGNAADRIFGGNGDDEILGGNGDDEIFGGLGQDILFGGNGDDRILGGGNIDQISGDSGDDFLVGQSGDDEISGGIGDDEILGTDGSDELSGDGGEDVIYGGDGEDVLSGGSGADQIFGQADNDELLGEAGNDVVRGGNGDDIIYGGSGADRISGDSGSDELYGQAGNDVIRGGNGNDRLYGNSGRDELFGDLGNDGLFGGIGSDNDRLAGGNGSDRFLLWGSADSVLDNNDLEGVVRFANSVSRRLIGNEGLFGWTEAEIQAVDDAFQEAHDAVGTSILLRDTRSNNPITFIKTDGNGRVRYGGINYSSSSQRVIGLNLTNDSLRYGADRTFNFNNASERRTLRRVVQHELGHNWDSTREIQRFLSGSDVFQNFESLERRGIRWSKNQITIENFADAFDAGIGGGANSADRARILELMSEFFAELGSLG